LIGFCTLYVASTSACEGLPIPPTDSPADATSAFNSGGKILYCYCNNFLSEIYTNSVIENACSSISAKVLMTNLLQIGASVLSSITNVILAIIITAIAKKLLRPNTVPKEYVFIFWGVLVSNYINSIIIPLLLNADIFGLQSIEYLKFINFMDFNNISIFDDFNSGWYALISPYYTTMIIISCLISPIISLISSSIKNGILHWRIKSVCEKQDK